MSSQKKVIAYSVAYVLSVLLANIYLADFIPLPFYGKLSIGTIFFAVIFTLRDRIHHNGGIKAVLIAIACAVVVNTASAIYMETPWRFVFASFFAILCSELADTAVFQRFSHRAWGFRVMSSNALSVPLDTLLFTVIAFYGIMNFSEMLQIMYADIVVKYTISLLLIVRWHLAGEKKAGVTA